MGSGDTSFEALVSDAQAGMRLDRALAALLPELSRERIKALILSGQVRSADGRPASDPSAKVQTEARFLLTLPPPEPSAAVAQPIGLKIVHEDEHLVVIDKVAGMVVHPAAGNLEGTLVNALLAHCEGQLSGIGGVARPGIVHRIDKDTSGLLVVAKTDRAHEGLARQFKDHSVRRHYLALTIDVPAQPAGTVRTWIGRSDSDRRKMAVQPEGRGKHAVTHWRTARRLDNAAMVECRLETGRTHQVRVHMAHIGHPLLGDPLYARGQNRHRELLKSLGFHRQALHAATLGFIHPVDGSDLDFSSPLPDDMQLLFTHLSA